MKCPCCGNALIKLDRYEDMAEFDEEMTEGQEADYVASLESGENGAWNVAVVEYGCKRCKIHFENVSDSLKTFKSLIDNWHNKAARESDYFSKFVFEYLGFAAHLKNNLYPVASYDRHAIQHLKADNVRKDIFLRILKYNSDVNDTLKRLVSELDKYPLLNASSDPDYPEVDGRWNDSKIKRDKNRSSKMREGVIHSTEDWENIVELWYGVRNNLFHGGKNPNVYRDQFLVKCAYKTLAEFMEIEIGMF